MGEEEDDDDDDDFDDFDFDFDDFPKSDGHSSFFVVALLAAEVETARVIEFMAQKNDLTIEDLLRKLEDGRSPKRIAEDLTEWVRDQTLLEVRIIRQPSQLDRLRQQQVRRRRGFDRGMRDREEGGGVERFPSLSLPPLALAPLIETRRTTLRDLYTHRVQQVLEGMKIALKSDSPEQAYLKIMRKLYKQSKKPTYYSCDSSHNKHLPIQNVIHLFFSTQRL